MGDERSSHGGRDGSQEGLFLIKADLATAADPRPTSQYQWLTGQYGNMLQENQTATWWQGDSTGLIQP